MKLIVIGLDGAFYQLVKKWCDTGIMPNLRLFITKGVSGILKSTIPANTCPAIPVFYTGKNPGNTGIFDFLKPDGSLVTYRDIDSSTLWELLNHYEYKQCVAGLRATYPPPDVNGGVFISAIHDPTEDSNYVNPRERKEEFKDFYPMKVNKKILTLNKNKSQNEELILYYQLQSTKHQIDFFKEMIKKEKPQFGLLWIGGTDFIQHYFWYNTDILQRFFGKLDKMLGDFIQDFPNTNLVIMSDHGFGPASEYNFHLNEWLQKEDYLKMQGNMFKRLTTRIGYNLAEYAISDSLKKKMLNFLSKGENKNKKSTKNDNLVITPLNNIPGVDWSSTQAHLTTAKGWGIRIIKENLDRPYEEVRDEIIQKLKQLKDPKGNRVIKDAWRGEEIYWGKYQDQIPDIIFLKEDIFRVRPSLVGKMFTKIKKRYGNYVGNHDSSRDGIFIAHGPDIKESGEYIGEVQLYDIAPTILHMYGIPVPEDMDGRVLKEIFKEDSEPGRREVRYQKTGEEEKLISNKISKLKKSGKI